MLDRFRKLGTTGLLSPWPPACAGLEAMDWHGSARQKSEKLVGCPQLISLTLERWGKGFSSGYGQSQVRSREILTHRRPEEYGRITHIYLAGKREERI